MIVSRNTTSPGTGEPIHYADFIEQHQGNVGATLLAHERMVRHLGQDVSGQNARGSAAEIISKERDGLIRCNSSVLGRLAQAEPHRVVGPNAAIRLRKMAMLADDDGLGKWLVRKATALEDAQTSPGFTSAVAHAKDTYAAFVDMGVQAGWLAGQAREQITRVYKTDMRLADATAFPDTATAATLEWGNDHVLVYSNGVSADAAATALEVGPHELHHATIQNRPEAWKAGRNLPLWFLEAMAEHARVTIRYGEFDTLNPMIRSCDTGVYVNNRRLTAMLRGDGPVETLTRADSGGQAEVKSLQRTLEEKWQVQDPLWLIDAALARDTRYPRVNGNVESNYQREQAVLAGYCADIKGALAWGQLAARQQE